MISGLDICKLPTGRCYDGEDPQKNKNEAEEYIEQLVYLQNDLVHLLLLPPNTPPTYDRHRSLVVNLVCGCGCGGCWWQLKRGNVELNKLTTHNSHRC